MVLTCIGFSPTAAFAAEENIALNKPATTSRADYNNPEITPSMAVDGTTSTRWASGPYYPQQHGPTDENWICIDLGAVYDISRVVLNWEAAYSPDYDIQVSNDYTTFTTIYNGSASGASVRTWSSLEQAVTSVCMQIPYTAKITAPRSMSLKYTEPFPKSSPLQRIRST